MKLNFCRSWVLQKTVIKSSKDIEEVLPIQKQLETFWDSEGVQITKAIGKCIGVSIPDISVEIYLIHSHHESIPRPALLNTFYGIEYTKFDLIKILIHQVLHNQNLYAHLSSLQQKFGREAVDMAVLAVILEIVEQQDMDVDSILETYNPYGFKSYIVDSARGIQEKIQLTSLKEYAQNIADE